jgi:hypothetical protein
MNSFGGFCFKTIKREYSELILILLFNRIARLEYTVVG